MGRDNTRPGGHVKATPQSAMLTAPASNASPALIRMLHALPRSRRRRLSRPASRRGPPTFERDVEPILTRAGCNAGACHGKARGQNGFQLSLLGFDPDFDYHAITHEARGRRVFPAAPEQQPAAAQGRAAQVPHGGGKRLADGDADVRRRSAAGSPPARPRTPADAPTLDAHHRRAGRAHPGRQAQSSSSPSPPTTPTARREDVTHLATFQSNESVHRRGRRERPGQGRPAARRGGDHGPLHGEVRRLQRRSSRCPATVAGGRLRQAAAATTSSTASSGPSCSSSASRPRSRPATRTFLRRAYLDVIGRLPTPDEARAFLADNDAGQARASSIDRLLERPEYADFWANKWADLLRPNPYRVGIKAVVQPRRLAARRASARTSRTTSSSARSSPRRAARSATGPAVVFRDRREPDEITTMVSQLFLGVRLDCAKCHHHPFEVWGQDDFYSFAAFFAPHRPQGPGHLAADLRRRGGRSSPAPTRRRCKHPLTGKVMTPRPLFGKAG